MSTPKTPPLKIAVAGLGTVGAGLLRMLHENAEPIAARAGRRLEVVAVCARDRSRDRGISLEGLRWYDDPVAMAQDPDVDVVVELMGGSDGPARAVADAAITAGKPVVTANKALIAVHGAALAARAEQTGVPLLFEAAVAGGIPVIKALREGLSGNQIERVTGILNGTCNYILTEMQESGREFDDVLGEAQRLGYAEADPSFDIDGVDAAHKLAILAALSFGRTVAFKDVHVEGIRAITALDIAYARELGYRIKLLGIARRTPAGVETRVHPCMLPLNAPLAHVNGVFNGVVAEGNFAGTLMLQGRGAGAGPTASAVTSDLIDIARERLTPVWGAASSALSTAPNVSIDEHRGAYYLRLMLLDRPGAIADVTAALRDAGVSLSTMLQHGRAPAGQPVPVVLVTHETREHAMRTAVERIAALDTVLHPPALIRIERD